MGNEQAAKQSSVPKETISVLALGNWGTALANHLARNGYKVIGWSIEDKVVEGINRNRRNPFCFADVELSPNLKATGDISEALTSSTIVLACPASVLREVTVKLRLKPGTLLISAIKGIERETVMTPLQFLRKELGPETELAVLSGPSFAIDIVRAKPSGVVAASEKEETAKRVADLFTSPAMKVYISTDPIGVELGGIAKNVIAIAVGICDGLEFGDSARAGLITRGLAEMMRLAEAFGADRRTLAGLSGLGDLAMTATSDTSRNRQVGLRIGKGESLQSIIKSLGSVAEGVYTAELILKLAAQHNVDMPITKGVAMILSGELKLEDTQKYLLSRPTKREF